MIGNKHNYSNNFFRNHKFKILRPVEGEVPSNNSSNSYNEQHDAIGLIKLVYVSISWALHCDSQAGEAMWVHILQLRKLSFREMMPHRQRWSSSSITLVEFFELGTSACVPASSDTHREDFEHEFSNSKGLITVWRVGSYLDFPLISLF